MVHFSSTLGLLLVVAVMASGLLFNVSANQKRDLKEEIHKNLVVTGEYEITQGIRQVTDTRGHILYNLDKFGDLKGKFAFTAYEYDIFEICLTNHAPAGQTTQHEFSFVMKYGVETKNYDDIAKAEHFKPIEKSLDSSYSSLESMLTFTLCALAATRTGGRVILLYIVVGILAHESRASLPAKAALDIDVVELASRIIERQNNFIMALSRQLEEQAREAARREQAHMDERHAGIRQLAMECLETGNGVVRQLLYGEEDVEARGDAHDFSLAGRIDAAVQTDLGVPTQPRTEDSSSAVTRTHSEIIRLLQYILVVLIAILFLLIAKL